MISDIHLAGICLSLFALWLFWYFCWKDYVTDKFRQDVFALRDELFVAVAGEQTPLCFNSREYQMFRNELNASIRCARHITLFRIFAIYALKALTAPGLSIEDLEEDSKIIREDTPEDIKAYLKPYQDRYGNYVIRYLATVSPTFVLIVATIVIMAVAYAFLRGLVKVGSRIFTMQLHFFDKVPHYARTIFSKQVAGYRQYFIRYAVIDCPLDINSRRQGDIFGRNLA
jgi:hypothetical protein